MADDTNILPNDQNFVRAAGFESSSTTGLVMAGQIDEITGRILVDNAGGGGGITIGTTTITSGTTTRILYDNAGVVGEYTLTGSGTAVVMQNTPTLITPVLGVATATSINGLTITSSTGTVTITNAKTLAITNTLTFSGTDSTVMTFPTTSATIARTDAGQTFTGVNNFTSPDITTSITTASTSFTAFAGATTLLTIGGTGASASLFAPSTLDTSSSTTGAIRTSGGISAAKSANIGTTITVGTGYQIGGAAASNKILKGNGTNFVASTETYAAPGTSGNVMTSDGTNWTSAAPSGGSVLDVTISLSSAQLKAIVATPPTMVAAPGAGFAIQILNSFWVYTRITASYTDGDQYSFVYDGDTTNLLSTTITAGSFFNAATSIQTARTNGTSYEDLANVENKAVKLANTGGISELATGSGTCKIFIQYRIITL